jgi:hypothetical protein
MSQNPITYQTLTKFDENKARNSDNCSIEIREILKDFMFKDLLNEPSVFCNNVPKFNKKKPSKKYQKHKCSIQKIRHSIINYLYSGKFKLHKDKSGNYSYSDSACEKIKKQKIKNKSLTPDSFFEPIQTSWNHIIKNYNDYLTKLGNRMSTTTTKISKIVVYEAPPYNDKEIKNVEKYYFLTNKSSNYYASIKNCFESNSTDDPIDFLVNNEIGFFEISIACLPLSEGDIRKDWNTKPYFKIGDKQITVVLFEIGFEHFITKIGIDKIATNPLFAIGAPVNCSAGIFEYYSKKILNVYKDKGILFFDKPNNAVKPIISVDLGLTNSATTYMRRNASGETFPLFKSNIVNSGAPSADLMKNAFNMEILITANKKV